MLCDFLYVFDYPEKVLSSAVTRLKHSIKSIAQQDVRICVYNQSSKCILDELKPLASVVYLHHPSQRPFSKSQAVNVAVEQMIHSEYFCVSDIDLIYQPTHIDSMRTRFGSLNATTPIRWIFFNFNMSPPLTYRFRWLPFVKRLLPHKQPVVSSDFKKLAKLIDCEGNFAHGNGLIHLQSFKEVGGYDERFVGYGPEDDLFNTKIGKVNFTIYDSALETATIHLWHPPYHLQNFEKNKDLWRASKLQLLQDL